MNHKQHKPLQLQTNGEWIGWMHEYFHVGVSMLSILLGWIDSLPLCPLGLYTLVTKRQKGNCLYHHAFNMANRCTLVFVCVGGCLFNCDPLHLVRIWARTWALCVLFVPLRLDSLEIASVAVRLEAYMRGIVLCVCARVCVCKNDHSVLVWPLGLARISSQYIDKRCRQC